MVCFCFYKTEQVCGTKLWILFMHDFMAISEMKAAI